MVSRGRRVRRGEIWWANLDQPAGRRPVLLLSRDEAYAVRDYIILCPITRRRRGLRSEVELGPEEGLPRPSVANLDVIITEPKGRLLERVSDLSPEKLAAVEAAIHFALDLET